MVANRVKTMQTPNRLNIDQTDQGSELDSMLEKLNHMATKQQEIEQQFQQQQIHFQQFMEIQTANMMKQIQQALQGKPSEPETSETSVKTEPATETNTSRNLEEKNVPDSIISKIKPQMSDKVIRDFTLEKLVEKDSKIVGGDVFRSRFLDYADALGLKQVL